MRHKGVNWAAFLVAGSVLVTGCDTTRSVIGLEKQSPDEFAVVPRAPLSVPPDFGLRPPTPGAQRPQEETVRDQARDVLIADPKARPGSSSQAAAGTTGLSPGETALLADAGALHTDPSIRSVVNRENTAMVEATASVFDKVLFWHEVEPPGTIVDPEKESRRLREASAIGDPPNKGEVPVIKRRERGILEGIF